MEDEVWVVHSTGLFVSNLGRVKTPGRTPLGWHVCNGYAQLSRVVRGRRPYVHQLVIEAFEGVRPGQVRRVNEDKLDNRLCNLRFVPRSWTL